MRVNTPLTCAAVAATTLLATQNNLHAQGAPAIIASTNQPAPDANGLLDILGPPTLNNNGQTAFWFLLKNTAAGFDDDQGIFRSESTPGPLTTIVREPAAAPDGDGKYLIFELQRSAGALSDNGNVAFRTFLTNTANDDGIFVGNGGPVTQIARLNQTAPNGGTFDDFVAFRSGGLGVNNAGKVTFFATATNEYVFSGSGAAITQVTDVIDTFWALHPSGHTAHREDGADRIFESDNGAQTQIVELNQPAPDANGVFFDLLDVAVNSTGQVAFASFMDGTSNGALDDKGIFRGSGAAITQIMRTGQSLPVGAGNFHDFINSQPSINDLGQVAFTAQLRDTPGGVNDDSGIFYGDGSNLKQIVREGQTAPDGNGEFDKFVKIDSEIFGYHAPTINNLGWVAFMADLRNTANAPVDTRGLFLGDGIDVVQIARDGDTILGETVQGNGVAFVSIPNEGREAINDSGQIAYRVWTNGPGGFKSHIALWTPPTAKWNTASGNWSDTTKWDQGVLPKSLFHTTLNPPTDAIINTDFTSEHVRTLTIGGGTANTTLVTQPGSTLTVVDGLLQILNNGILTGGGTIEAQLINTDGEVIAPAGQQLTFTNPGSTNDARVTLTGGELRFLQDFTNNGTVIGNGTLRADAGTTNTGTLAFSATSNVVGQLTNNPSALIVTAGGTTTFLDDVTNLGEIRTTDGSTSVFFGNVNMASNFTDTGKVVFLAGVSPGLSPGIVSFDGDVQFGPSASVLIEIQEPTPDPTATPTAGDDYDQLTITNSLTLNGTLNVQPLALETLPVLGTEIHAILYGERTPDSMFHTINGTLINTAFAFAPLISDSDDPDSDDDQLILRATIPGDLNLDNRVSVADLSTFALNFNTNPGLYNDTTSENSWELGDFNTDGQITVADLSLLALNFGFDLDAATPALGLTIHDLAAIAGLDLTGASIPEPTTTTLLLHALLATTTRRKS